MSLVEVRELSKRYGSVTVIEGIQFNLDAGGSMAVVGPNGSGKTTLVRCLLGLVEASEGIVQIAGSAYQSPGPTRIGYLPEDRGHFQRDRVIDVLRRFGTLRGLDSRAAVNQAHEYLEEMGLGSLALTEIQTLSNGQQQKVHGWLPHDRHIRFGKVSVVGLPGGLDRLSSHTVRDIDGMTWTYKWNINQAQSFRSAEERVRKAHPRLICSP